MNKHERLLKIAGLVHQIEAEMSEDDDILSVNVSKWSWWTNVHVFTANGQRVFSDYTDQPIERTETIEDGGGTRIEYRSTVDGVPVIDMFMDVEAVA